MDRVLDMQGTILSEAIENLVPNLRGNRIERNLLDGSLHVQVIGDARKEITFKIYVKSAGMNRINELRFIGAPIKVEFDGITYTGKVSNDSDWGYKIHGELAERVYETELKVVVESEVGL